LITQKGRKLVSSNQVFDIFYDHIQEPSGLEIENYLVVSPKHKTAEGITGVAILPYSRNAGGDVTLSLIEIYRHATQKTLLEIPRGFVDTDELVEKAALRELYEETGLACPLKNLTHLFTLYPEPGVISGRVAVFSAETNLDPVTTVPNLEFGLGLRLKKNISEALDMIASGKIEDNTTIAAIQAMALRSVKPNTSSF